MQIKRYIEHLEKKKTRQQKRAYIKALLIKHKIEFKTQKFFYLFGSGENIIVDISDKNLHNKKRILLSAHYDTAWNVPGANDNASGVAVLLHTLIMHNNTGKTPFRVIFFDQEEQLPFLLGSKAYVKKYGTSDISQMYNLDSVGRGDMMMIWITEDVVKYVDKLLVNVKKQNILYIFAPPFLQFARVPLGFISDHLPFVKKGLKNACTITMVTKEDIDYGRTVIQQKNILHLLWSLTCYYVGQETDLPFFLRHYHNKQDISTFVQESTLRKVYLMLTEIVQ